MIKKFLLSGGLIIVGIGILLLLGTYYGQQPAKDFAECVAAGNPVMESYPRQCRAGGQTFTEKINDDKQAGIANPASVKCVSDGGRLDTRTDEHGGQYGVCVFADNSECEEWAYFRGECALGDSGNSGSATLSQGDALLLAGNWVQQNAPTYVYDGNNLQLDKAEKLADNSGYQFVFSFVSSHAGYGDRTGQMVAQVIAEHTITIQVKDSQVVYAVTDELYNEILKTKAGK